MRPIKNYIIACVIVVITVFLTLYLKKMYEVNNKSDLEKNEISYSSLENYLYENPEVIIYFKNGNIKQNFDEEFIDVINDNSLLNQTVYIDVSELSENDKSDFYSKYCSNFTNKDSLYSVPNIVLVKDKKVVAVFNQFYPDLNSQNISSFLISNGWLND
ncbi:MAG: hypothetical protein IJ134_03760 [Bacilli bacterium]|nr:hypothetical protein [Bacilli bacterium]